MLELFDNKIAFMNKKPKIGFTIILLVVIILIYLLLYISKEKIYDHYQSKGLVTCKEKCVITTLIPSNLNFDKIKLNKKYLNYEIINKELKTDEEKFQSYYELTITTNNKLTNNEIVDLNFYYNKQRIITKIKEKMF